MGFCSHFFCSHFAPSRTAQRASERDLEEFEGDFDRHYSASQRRRMPGSSATLVPETGVQRDWEEREFAQSIQLGIKSLAQFLNDFGLR